MYVTVISNVGFKMSEKISYIVKLDIGAQITSLKKSDQDSISTCSPIKRVKTSPQV